MVRDGGEWPACVWATLGLQECLACGVQTGVEFGLETPSLCWVLHVGVGLEVPVGC